MKRLLGVCALAMAMLGTPLVASAQSALADDDGSGVLSAGAYAGAELDTPDKWLLFGADARIRVPHGLELEPRLTYQPLNGGHLVQLDANVLENLDLASPGRLRPFVGVGGTLTHYAFDSTASDTKVGLNLVWGARIPMTSSAGYEPFIMGQYSIVRNQPNAFTIVVGASFRLHH